MSTDDRERQERPPADQGRAKELGEWIIRRSGDNEIALTIPEGMRIVGDDLTIEDIAAAAVNYAVVKQGRVLACCSGNVAIA
jgi:hypothetical protein